MKLRSAKRLGATAAVAVALSGGALALASSPASASVEDPTLSRGITGGSGCNYLATAKWTRATDRLDTFIVLKDKYPATACHKKIVVEFHDRNGALRDTQSVNVPTVYGTADPSGPHQVVEAKAGPGDVPAWIRPEISYITVSVQTR
jgi:hypothetical protein